MKVSKYNIIVEAPQTGETILFNSLYGSLTTWDQDEIREVKRILGDFPHAEDSNLRDILIQQKHLIDDSLDEKAIIENRKIAGIKDNNRLDLIIMPTLDCNFACIYCYESNRPSKMTRETENRVKEWLSAQVPKYKFVMVLWFGGEPLLGYQQIISITNHVKNIAAREAVSFVTHVTTNGYLLNKKRINELINIGIYDFQITLDGPPETHDKLRVLKSGRGTFDRIFQNIIELARADESVRISLRINFNHGNLHSIPLLLEMFPNDIRQRLRVVYEPIFGNCSLSATENIPSQEISEAMANYYILAEQLGYEVVLGLGNLQPGKLVYCYAERENQFIINYNGEVFKCSVSKFLSEERVGYLGDKGIFIKDDENWNRWTGSNLFEEKCYSCIYLPLCMGGCRRARLQHEGTGSYCSLIPTNAHHLLKQIALGNFENIIRSKAGG